jgi:hypothetical protein
MRFLLLGLVLGLLATTSLSKALADCGGGCCTHQCPNCNATCRSKVSEGKEEKHCWDTKCETVCIPRITFPWEKCCTKVGDGCCGKCCPAPAPCGKVITVRRLMKHEYECPVCKYSWEVNDCGGCNGCSGGGCTAQKQQPQRAPADVRSTPVVEFGVPALPTVESPVSHEEAAPVVPQPTVQPASHATPAQRKRVSILDPFFK